MTAALPDAPRCSCGRPMRPRTAVAVLPLLPVVWTCPNCDAPATRTTEEPSA